MRSDKHLKFIRSLPCCVCRAKPPSEAAHIRLGSDGGMGLKPSDKFTVPLCHMCHSRQHQTGERTFWGNMEFILIQALALYAVSGDWEKGVKICMRIARNVS